MPARPGSSWPDAALGVHRADQLVGFDRQVGSSPSSHSVSKRGGAVDRDQQQRSAVREPVGFTRRADDHVAGLDHRRLVADPEGRLARLHDEDLGIRMAVELRADARRGVDEDHRERQVPEVRADELLGVLRVVEPVERDDRAAPLAQDRTLRVL